MVGWDSEVGVPLGWDSEVGDLVGWDLVVGVPGANWNVTSS